MKKQFRLLKEVIIPFCEGEAEINLFGFLKIEYSNNKRIFKKPVNLGGIGDFKMFIKKYAKRIKEQNLKPAKEFQNVKLLFIIDNDLEDSKKIEEFLAKHGHMVELCDPNTEGMILAILNRTQIKVLGDKEYRKKCKENFKRRLGCEAHKISQKQLKNVFKNENIFKKNLPLLYKLFRE